MSAFMTETDRQALDWMVRVNDPGFEAWADWEAWMVADALHADAYWRLAEAEADAVAALKSAPIATVHRIMPPRPALLRRRSALAAAFALLALGGGWFGWSQRPQPWIIETAPGETRSVTLDDGTEVFLAGETRLSLDRRTPRHVTLDSGRALFEVVHDATDPFVVLAGAATLTDLGTTFDVTRLGDAARVGVSEGVVRVDIQTATATLNPGDGVLATADGLEHRPVAPEDVAGWREGRLSYAGERLDVVAADLTRALNRSVTVSPSLASRRFSGSLTVTAGASVQRRRLEDLLGVSVVEDGKGWRLEP